jgi:hypothetical protein
MLGLDHLKNNKESYFVHQRFAFVYGWKLLVAAIASFIHGVFPGVLKFYSARTVIGIYKVIEKRNRPGEQV